MSKNETCIKKCTIPIPKCPCEACIANCQVHNCIMKCNNDYKNIKKCNKNCKDYCANNLGFC